MRKKHTLSIVIFAGAILLLSNCMGEGGNAGNGGGTNNKPSGWYIVEPVSLVPPPWPEWVLKHWVWYNESTQDSAIELAEDYLAHDIPVAATIIDAPWETAYNTFEWDTSLYPDPQAMIDHFHSLGVRVFMWITSIINVEAPNYQYACDRGYFLNNCKTFDWWHGTGSYIDYTNPAALAWWHGLMDQLLDLGIDAWKCDGGETYLYTWLNIQGYAGQMSAREYQDMYYRDFFYYSRERLGPDRVITSRPYDSYGLPVGLIFAPRDVCLAGWVGDQDPTFEGLRAAMFNMFKSAKYNYVNFGSDVAGFRGNDPRDKELYIRWAQYGALSPIMENGGNGEHRPWMYDDETLEIYRNFTLLHQSLLPYLYSQGAISYAAEIPLMRPYEQPGAKWQYYLGDALFVAAYYEAGDTRAVQLPEGKWYDFFTEDEYTGGTTFSYQAPLDRFPLFIKSGEILVTDPLDDRLYKSDDKSLLVICYPQDGDSFEFYEEGGNGSIIAYERSGTGWQFSIAATNRNFGLQLRKIDKPAMVDSQPDGLLKELDSLKSLRSAKSGWFYDATKKYLWIKPATFNRGQMISVQYY